MDDTDVRREIRAALHEAAAELEGTIHAVDPVEFQDEMRALHFDLLAVLSSVSSQDPARLMKDTVRVAGRLDMAGPVLSRARKRQPEYKTGSFQCKRDCDACLIDASSALEKALCYALFARCIAKG